MRTLKYITLAIGILGASAANAQSWYGSVSFAQTNIKGGSEVVGWSVYNIDDSKPTAFIGAIGMDLNQSFAVEARLGTGVSNDSVTISSGSDSINVDIKMDTYYGVYGKAKMPVGSAASLYVLAGYSNGKAKVSYLGDSVTTDSSGSGSYGVGMNFAISPNMGVQVEWARLFEDVDAVSAGLVYKF